MRKKYHNVRFEIYKILRSRSFLTYALILSILYIVFRYVIYEITKIIPEIPMVYYSKCINPFISWDGKIMKVPLYTNGYKNRQPFYNINKNLYADGTDRRRLLSNDITYNNITNYLRKLDNNNDNSIETIVESYSNITNKSEQQKTVIFWGTHHKTGSYLALKLFSSICGHKGNWCCISLVTRDTIHFLNNILATESNINVLGHSQWLWYPEVFDVKYKFIHFYRHPFNKIISGYFYHKKGIERWTKDALNYSQVCNKTIISKQHIDRSTVINYCSGVHLCQGCCRKEHEASIVMLDRVNSSFQQKKNGRYYSRNPFEYKIICNTLGQVDTSLQHKLETISLQEGLKIEASLDYYENLRMMRIVDHTWNDPYTLNVNIDELAYNYKETIKKILYHIEPDRDFRDVDVLAKKLDFYDAETSYMYRLLHNLFNGEHIHKRSNRYGEEQKYYKILQEDKDIMKLYSPILSLYTKNVRKGKST